jgi:hypothetical protein
VEPGDIVVSQFPSDYKAEMYSYYLSAIHERGAVAGVMVHDVPNWLSDGWRDGDFPEKFVQEFDFMITHTKGFGEAFRERGYHKPIFYNVFFDYINTAPLNKMAFKKQVFSAGNTVKSYNLTRWTNETQLIIYDNIFDSIGKEDDLIKEVLASFEEHGVDYCGQREPDQLSQEFDGGFGILTYEDLKYPGWYDKYSKEYARINSPLKLSLYLSSGLPVIVDDYTPSADFIERYALGFKISDITEIDEKLSSFSEADYQRMADNVAKFAQLLRTGYFTKRVLSEVAGYDFKD